MRTDLERRIGQEHTGHVQDERTQEPTGDLERNEAGTHLILVRGDAEPWAVAPIPWHSRERLSHAGKRLPLVLVARARLARDGRPSQRVIRVEHPQTVPGN